MKAKLFRIAATVLALTLAVSTAACGTAKKTTKKTSSKESVSSKQIESVEETPSEEESSSEESSSEESSAQQPSSQAPAAPAAPSQQKSVSPEEAAKNMSPKSKTLRLRDLTEAELQIVANAAIERINSKVQLCNGGHELTPDSDLNKIAHHINELLSSGTVTSTKDIPYDFFVSLPEMKPFLYALTAPEPELFAIYFGKSDWNQTEVTVTKDYFGAPAPFDALIDGTGDIDLVTLGHEYGFELWNDNVSLDNENYRYIGASADLINGQLYVTVICATSKTES